MLLCGVIEPHTTKSRVIPVSQIPAWITPSLIDSPQAFRLSGAPTASCEQVQITRKSMFNLCTLKILPTKGTIQKYLFLSRTPYL
jgi:hypothetical protein